MPVCYQDVRPNHVGIRNWENSNSNEYELVERLKWPVDAEEANTWYMENEKPLYCSPLLFEHVATKSKGKCNDNRAKSDLFSIGMTILSLGLGKSVQDCYHKDSKKFDGAKKDEY